MAHGPDRSETSHGFPTRLHGTELLFSENAMKVTVRRMSANRILAHEVDALRVKSNMDIF